MTDRQPTIFDVSNPPTIWALHFAAIYAGVSAVCAPRAYFGHGILQVATAVTTLVALLAVGYVWYRMRRGAAHGGVVGIAADWSAAISAVAVLFSAVPVFLIPYCN
jgi:hypothetical protein